MTTSVDGLSGITTPRVDSAQGVGGGPTFRAAQSSSQIPVSGVITKLNLIIENYDTNNNYDTAQSRFTPTVPGYYRVSGTVRCLGGTALTGAFAYVYKNGAQVSQGGTGASGFSGLVYALVNDLVFMNGSTDYLELWGAVTASSGQSFEFVNAGTCSSFSSELVRAV